MNFDYVFQTLSSGWLTEAEARLLWNCCERTTGDILEVGCFRGRSTVLLAAHGRTVYAVDPFAGFDTDDPDGSKAFKDFADNMAARDIRNVQLFRMRIEEWKPRPVGLAYLDGDHTYVGTLRQIGVALDCGASFIAVHDVNDYGGGLEVRRACLEVLGQWNERVGKLAMWNVRHAVFAGRRI